MRKLLIFTAASAGLLSIAAWARAAGPPGGHYVVDTAASHVEVLVYRGGLLGRLGHNHVISLAGIAGHATVQNDPLQADVALLIPVSGMTVDDPAAREVAGDDFPGAVPADDRAGTRRNMLGPKLLDLADDAVLHLQSVHLDGDYPDLRIALSVTIRGNDRTLNVPLHIEMIDGALHASGETKLQHKDLGLKPFAAALGALRVRDKLTLRYEIVARR